MSTHQDVQERQVHEADPDTVEVRQPEAGDDGLMRIRMPVSSTGEARDGEAFDVDRLRGFAEQIEGERIPLFLDHGRGGPGETRYGQLRKVGYWDAPSIEERGGTSELDADAVLVDPDTLDEDVGQVRSALAWLRAQAEAGLPISASVGWTTDTGERDVPGDADLLEISIVGIPSDPRTTTASSTEPALARAVASASSDFDVDEFVDALRSATGRAEYEVGDDETVTINPPEVVVNAATLALAKADEVDADCGTGVGDQRAQQLIDDEVGPDVIDEVAAYLTSHEEDVTAEGPPSDWSNEEWADCGNLQYAKWGGTGTGTGLEWAQDRANAVAEAKGEELPYPERSDHNVADEQDSMTESDTPSDEQSGDTTDDQRAEVGEVLDRLVEMQEEQTEILREIAESGMDGDGDDDGDDGDDGEDEDGDEESADVDTADHETESGSDETRMVDLDGERMAASDAVDHLRDQYDNLDLDGDGGVDPATEDRADESAGVESESETSEQDTAGASPDWRA